jgi:hypothetical protein
MAGPWCDTMALPARGVDALGEPGTKPHRNHGSPILDPCGYCCMTRKPWAAVAG